MEIEKIESKRDERWRFECMFEYHYIKFHDNTHTRARRLLRNAPLSLLFSWGLEAGARLVADSTSTVWDVRAHLS